MDDICKILNFLKWQMIARMPHGSITSRIINGRKYQDILSEDNPFYYIYWRDLARCDLLKYILGTFKTNNSDYLEFITWLNQNFASGDFYEIKVNDRVITIPIPTEIDYKCFKAEFLDIIMPELVYGTSMPVPFLEGPYEYGNVQIKENTNVLDIGANYGLFSSLASSKGARVYAFEPTPRVLTQYLRPLEQKDKNIHVIERAVTNKTGKVFFNVDDANTSCNCIVDSHNIMNSGIIVNTTTIDDFMDFTHLDSLDFIKADIEGAERLMLEGAQDTLRELAPDLAICTYHRLDDPEVLTDLILRANPDYEITRAHKKLYARSRKKR